MKKITFTITFALFALFLTILSVNAQLPTDSVAPDFTITDLSGNTHHLYEYLDQGKIVIVDVFSTWCPPCWDYVNSGALQQMWDEYGPNGKKDVVMLLVEGDQMTKDGCITGDEDCSMTQGNWLEIVDFPVAGDTGPDLARNYQVMGYPSVFVIYPNRLVKQIGPVPFEQLLRETKRNDAFVKKKKNNVAVIGSDIEELSCKEIRPTFKFQNLGKAPLTSFQIALSVNGKVVQEETWKGKAETYELIKMTFAPITVKEETQISIIASKPNEKKDRKKKNNVYQTQTFSPYLDATSNLTFRVHSIGANNSVDIKILDENKEPIMELLDQVDQEGGVLIDLQEYKLPKENCYELVIEDAYKTDKIFTDDLSVEISNNNSAFKATMHHIKRGPKHTLQLKIPLFYQTE